MGKLQARLFGACDLGSHFFARRDDIDAPPEGFCVTREIAVLVDKPRGRIMCGQWSPAIGFPFTRQRHVQADIRGWTGTQQGRSLRKPGARDHHRAGGDEPRGKQVDKSRESRLAHAEVIGMNDHHAIRRRKPQMAQHRIAGHDVPLVVARGSVGMGRRVMGGRSAHRRRRSASMHVAGTASRGSPGPHSAWCTRYRHGTRPCRSDRSRSGLEIVAPPGNSQA